MTAPSEILKDEGFNPQAKAIAMVRTLHYPDQPISDIYVVWFCKVLRNWKALVSTTIDDGFYYEVTFDGARNKTFVDKYAKATNTEFDPSTESLEQTHYLPESFL